MNVLREAGMKEAELLALTASRESCDMIVLCSRCLSFRQRFLDGCLAEQLAGEASCPVLCLPTPMANRFEMGLNTPSRHELDQPQSGTTAQDSFH